MRKRLLSLSIFLLFTFSFLTILNFNTVGVFAAEYPAIYIEPATTVDSTLTPGSLYTISVKTDYTGADITAYQFALSYDPSVLKIGVDGLSYTDIWAGTGTRKSFEATGKLILPDSEDVYVGGVLKTKGVDYTIDYQTGMITFTTAPAKGVEVKATYLYCLINGDLITTAISLNAMFNPGTADNVAGILSLTGAFFFFVFEPAPMTSGPGTLANVTFTVVGIGESDITLGSSSKLIGYTEDGMGDPYNIVDGETMPENLGHGYFDNTKTVFPVTADGQTFDVVVESNSTISNFDFRQGDKEIKFSVTGPDGTGGFCNVTIPTGLMTGSPWIIFINGVITSYIQSGNETYTFLWLKYAHSTKNIMIRGTWVVPEFPTPMPLLLALAILAASAIALKRKIAINH